MNSIDNRLTRLRSKLATKKIEAGEYVKPNAKLVAIMLDDQVGRCAICECEFTPIKVRPHVDHCHKTKKVRGLLCRECNLALGLLKDNVRVLERAISYLKGQIKFRP